MTASPKIRLSQSVPIEFVAQEGWDSWIKTQSPETARWCRAARFKGAPHSHCVISDKSGAPARVLAGVKNTPDIWSLGGMAEALPEGHYHIPQKLDKDVAEAVMLGWLIGGYRFSRYKKDERKLAVLAPPTGADAEAVQQMADAMNFARDLINTPANDMGPAELAAACRQVAKDYGAEYREIVGEELLRKNYPAIHAVGRASPREPRLAELRWGKKDALKVTLVGKGVCFDSGGLDLKPSAGMKLMKKDMGGAAVALALARVIIHAGLPVRLRVLIPAVENSVSGNSYRPMDVIETRSGKTVEIGNTDAEGRIILCDALCEADSENPDILIDFATLTGAARTALGTDIPALFTAHDSLAEDILAASRITLDPLWRLPLWDGYRDMLKSPVADLNSAPDGPYAGAITAALYLREFVRQPTPWAHIDMMAWNLSKRPGRPAGGEAMAVRAVFAFLKDRLRRKQKSGLKKRK